MTSKADCRRAAPPFWWPLALLLGLSVIFYFSQLDLFLQRLCWSPTDGWRLANHPVVQFLYHYGTWPAAMGGAAASVIWIALLGGGRWREIRALCRFAALVLIVGPGLLVNAGFKDHFGRTRPEQVTQFGGNQSFRPIGNPGPRGGGKSFPSGHASMGFYWLTLSVYFWSRQRNFAYGFAALGLIYGTLMGLGRMLQGGHWASDVLWAGGLVYFTAWIFHQFLFRTPVACPAQSTFPQLPATHSTNVLAT